MDEFLGPFKDAFGTYNITMTPVAGVKTNPLNMSAGTVSMNYDKEMKSLKTPEIAEYLTERLAEIRTISITNGSTPANLRLNDPEADFCQKGEMNGLTLAKKGYTYEKDGQKYTVTGFTPYEYKPVYENGVLVSDNIEEVLKAKKSNTQWLLDAVGGAFKRGGKPAVTRMFCSDRQISKGATVIGHLSEYAEGDMLFMGWGRADRQKGYPSTFQAFLEFLKDPTIPQETKKHTKLLVGAGVWDEHARDYNWVKDIIRQIEELDGGIYKGNACYVNNFFSNRFVGCATFTEFTSVFEPCGIVPLESFASGTPSLSTNTGGAPDFIASTRGYLTEHPFLRSVEDLGIDPKLLEGKTGEEYANTVNAQRVFSNAAEMKECMKRAVADYAKPAEEGKLSTYAAMVRDALLQKIDWHENAAYNNGRTANQRYMTEVFEIPRGMEARNTNPMKRLVGERFGIADTLVENAQKIRNKWTKAVVFTGIGIAALGTAAYIHLKNKAKIAATTKPEVKETPVQTTATTAPRMQSSFNLMHTSMNSFNKIA